MPFRDKWQNYYILPALKINTLEFVPKTQADAENKEWGEVVGDRVIWPKPDWMTNFKLIIWNTILVILCCAKNKNKIQL